MLSLFLTFIGLQTTHKQLLRYLQLFQQEEYHPRRFLLWWRRSRSIEPYTASTATCLALLLIAVAPWEELAWIVWMVGALLVLVATLWIQLPPAKKSLKMTARMQRLTGVTLLLQGAWLLGAGEVAIRYGATYAAPLQGLLLLGHVLLPPLAIVCANLLLWPVEAAMRRFYLSSARSRIQNVKPTILAITGSYGKTSTKHLLTQVLRSRGPTLMTPSSVNTLMGVSRVIREDLTQDHRFFVVEMGAYQLGSIQRLCTLAAPHIAIITNVGKAHLERFGSVEAIARAKAEIAATLPTSGWLIFNADNPHCRVIASQVSCRTMGFGSGEGPLAPQVQISDVYQKAEGLELSLSYEGEVRRLQLRLHGVHQAQNAAAAVAAAICVGTPFLQAVAALSLASPIPHRCGVSQVGGVTWIDDSYNSNPTGFQHALELLNMLPGNLRYLVTPGMVELGADHHHEHSTLAHRIAESCDQVCLVAPHRLGPLHEALLASGFPEAQIHLFAHFAEARDWLMPRLCPGDKVLLENDLPDILECTSAFGTASSGVRIHTCSAAASSSP